MKIKKTKKEKEGAIQLSILKYLRSERVFCWRNQPMTYNAKLGINITNPYVMRGTPDIIAVIDGVFTGFEVKTAKGRQSPDQVLFERRCKLHGGRYYVVRSVDEVKKILAE